MSALYLDASILVSLLTSEVVSDSVSDWLERQVGEVAVSEWSRVEFASAVSLKVRIGQLSVAGRAAAMKAFEDFARDVTVLAIAPSRYRVAVSFLERPELALRGPDALHLAICADRGDVLVTRDRRMAGAAGALGVKMHLL